MRDSDGDALGDMNVSLWASALDAPLDARTDQFGRFHTGNLAPGTYFALAWDDDSNDVAPDDWDDQSLRTKLETKAAKITLRAGPQDIGDLKITISSE